MTIFIDFVALFKGVFSLCVSLMKRKSQKSCSLKKVEQKLIRESTFLFPGEGYVSNSPIFA